ncbi:sigma-70 family RNA polymerase sigma factor [Virgisporangium aurantiacum]|uniref:sigma-70 family RNA polymerase sigma factor n=1 Tax=Virgisporangium aurantiacum TaxID=175570 RepID=UPI001EF3AA79|nr:sigma-70 family RNA polymerase sigma factor [Virgisporangium aurantiacum]
MTDQLLPRARAGDGAAFGELVEPFRRELHVHCYRILGSLQDAEDVLQETLVAAWRGLAGFDGRSSLRTWLYRIATNRCLNAVRDAKRRPAQLFPPGIEPPPPTRTVDPLWLDPYPDALLAALPDTAPGPEARYERHEAVSLAFLTAVQVLPPRQRAVLVLRDVLGYRAAEVAELLDTTVESVTSALKRARAALPSAASPSAPGHPAVPAVERGLADRFAVAVEDGDVDAMVALLTDDAWLTMPPAPIEYQGHAAIAGFMRHIGFRDGNRRYRLLSTRANGQPAFGAYISDGGEPTFRAHGIMVLTVAGDRLSAVTRFVSDGVLPHFGLPGELSSAR